MIRIFISTIIIFFLFISFHSIGQNNPRASLNRPLPSNTEGYVSFGMFVGASNYFGDIYADLSLTRPMLGIYINRKLGPRFYGRLSLSWGRIVGDDALSSTESPLYARNLHFRNSLKELSVVGIYELNASAGRFENRRTIAPYLFAGLALVHHNPQAKIDGEWIDLQPLGTEGQGRPNYESPYNKVQVAMPLGAGLRFRVNDRLDIGFEVGVRVLFFDYIDDVSGNAPNLDDLSSPLAQRLSNRSLETTAGRIDETRDITALLLQYGSDSYNGANGQVYNSLSGFEQGNNRGGDGQLNDFYIFTAFHFSYIIDVGLKCPQVFRK